jgi:serine/threonine protein kinase
MAPEQTGRMNRSIDARSDLYSLGVTLYEMLTGACRLPPPIRWSGSTATLRASRHRPVSGAGKTSPSRCLRSS